MAQVQQTLKKKISCEFVGDLVSSHAIMSTLEAFKSLSVPSHSIQYYFRHPEKTFSCFYKTYGVRETCVMVFIAVEYCFNFCLLLSLDYLTVTISIIRFFLYLLHFLIHCRECVLISSNKMEQYVGIYLPQVYSTCFGRPSRPSSGVQKTVTAASGTGHIT